MKNFLYLCQAASAHEVHISHETVPDARMPALFLAFQLDLPRQLLIFCSQEQPPGFFQLSDFIPYNHAQSSVPAGRPLSFPPRGQCSQPSGMSSGTSYLKESQELFNILRLMFVILLLQWQLTLCFAFKGFLFFFSQGLIYFFPVKADKEPSYFKKISSNFILPEYSVTSALLAPQLLPCSILG